MPEPLPSLENLLSAARPTEPAVARLEYAFETRLLARLREERSPSLFTCAWRLAPFFAAIALAAGLWGYLTASPALVENRLLSEASRQGEEQALLSHLTGNPIRP